MDALRAASIPAADAATGRGVSANGLAPIGISAGGGPRRTDPPAAGFAAAIRRLAFEGLQFAREHHKSDEYVDATLRAFFQEGLDIGQPQVLHDIARRVGLPDEAFAAALQQRRYAEAHKAALEQARETGIRAVPTLIVGEHRIEGMPSSEALRRAIGTSRVSVDSRIATPPGSE